MNKERRRRLTEICERLELIKDDLYEIESDEQDCFDSLPEQLQESYKGSDMSDNIDDIEDAVTDIENAISKIQDAIER